MKRKVHGNTGRTKSRRHRQRIAEGVRAHWARVHAAAEQAQVEPAAAAPEGGHAALPEQEVL